MKQAIGSETIVINGKLRVRTIWRHFPPLKFTGNPVVLEDIPPLDADPRLWKEGLYGGKERG